MTVTDLIRGPRQVAGLTQRGLAALARVPQPSIAQLESGAQADATIGLVQRLLEPCGSQLIAVPTTTPSVASAAAALRLSLREGHTGLLFRQLIQVSDDLASEPPATRVALCLTPAPLTDDRGVDAFLAALVEYRLGTDRLPVPDWTSRPERFCDPEWDVAGIPALLDDVRRSTPPPFRRHGVLIAEEDLVSV
jgi:transcriptional regulator with XRE-family HTH domain